MSSAQIVPGYKTAYVKTGGYDLPLQGWMPFSRPPASPIGYLHLAFCSNAIVGIETWSCSALRNPQRSRSSSPVYVDPVSSGGNQHVSPTHTSASGPKWSRFGAITRLSPAVSLGGICIWFKSKRLLIKSSHQSPSDLVSSSRQSTSGFLSCQIYA